MLYWFGNALADVHVEGVGAAAQLGEDETACYEWIHGMAHSILQRAVKTSIAERVDRPTAHNGSEGLAPRPELHCPPHGGRGSGLPRVHAVPLLLRRQDEV